MSTKAPQSKRLLFIDTLRGLAVLFMIQLHTSHGWLRPDAQAGTAWSVAQFFGGLAAPLFLFLAGAGLGLSWCQERTGETERSTTISLAPGLELIVIGYALRLQMWVMDGGAYARSGTYPAVLLLATGYALTYWGARELGRGRPAQKWLMFGATTALAGLWWAQHVDPRRAEGLLRVDALQCIGSARIILSVVGRRDDQRRVRWFVPLAALVALVSPLQQSWVPGALPAWLAAYIAQWPSLEGQRTLALFPLFPWLSYAATGVAAGLVWGRVETPRQLDRVLIGTVAAGALLALSIYANWPPLRWLPRTPAIVSLLNVTYKTGLCGALVGPALVFAHQLRWLNAPLRAFGRASLLVYCVHLELAFGILSRPVSKRLGTSEWLYGTLLLIAAMWTLAALRTSGLTRRILLNTVLRRRLATG